MRLLAGFADTVVWGVRYVSAILLLLVLTGCTAARFDPSTVGPDERFAVVFFGDGLQRDRFTTLLEQGALPSIERTFVAGGVQIERVMSGFPTVTYANTVSILTGMLPARHGITGNAWFDPQTLELQDYGTAGTYRRVNRDFRARTIHECLGTGWSASAQCPTYRGADVVENAVLASGLRWWQGRYGAVDRDVAGRVHGFVRSAAARGQWPKLMLFYLPGIDEIAHHQSVSSNAYAKALQTLDASVATVVAAIEDAGMRDRTIFVLLTDHGHLAAPPDRRFDLIDWLERSHDLRVRTARLAGGTRSARAARLRRYDAVAIVANRCIQLHLKVGESWTEPSRESLRALVEREVAGRRLIDLPAVGLLCARISDNRVALVGRIGTAIIDRRVTPRGARYRLSRYEYDPLGYDEYPQLRPFTAGAWFDGAAWFRATVDTQYPDLVPQVAELFASERGGDLVVLAEPGWSFSPDEASGHGALDPREALTSWYLAGPGLPAGARLPLARNVDFVPTLLDLLGIDRRGPYYRTLDGVSRAAEIRRAR